MRWAEQSARRWWDIERELDADHAMRRGFRRLRRVMAFRRFAGRFFATGAACAVAIAVVLLGLLLGVSGPAAITALITGGTLAAAITFALIWAVLDRPTPGVRQDPVDWIQ